MADEGAGVHIDGGHRLGLIDDDVATRLERHLTIQRLLDFLLHMVQFEDRSSLGVQLQARQRIRHESASEFLHFAECTGMVDQHPVHIRPQKIA